MSYLNKNQQVKLTRLLKTFFMLPYSTDLDGKDAEAILRIVKNVKGKPSKKKELFDMVDGETGYSIKTLRKTLKSVRVDLQEQRFCDVEEVRRLQTSGEENAAQQGKLLLTYMLTRVDKEMARRSVKDARSLILLKDWDAKRSNFSFRYWEEDFYGYIKELSERDIRGEIEWVAQGKGLHARDRRRQDEAGKNVRLLRMHYKHNQIFTDHDIPKDAIVIQFPVSPYSLERLHEIFELVAGKAGLPPDVTVQTESSLEKES